MQNVVPYVFDLEKSDGAFINPNNEIIFTYGSHENWALEYCSGNYLFFDDLFSGSKLTKEQLELFKLWLSKNEFNPRYMYSDFMVFLLGFDKVERIMRRAITTTSGQPHIRFYNYYLMDWNIDKRRRMRYNEDTGLFEYINSNDWVISSSEDREAELEIAEIKKNVLIKDRHHFLK